MNKALLKSEKPDWNTPEKLLGYVYSFFGDIADLDPCSNGSSIVKSRQIYDGSEGSNGLSELWHGNVFVNPPYGREILPWIEKAVDERKQCEILMLVPSRTDTRWWNLAVLNSTSVCFIKGRLTFLGAPHPAPFPSAVIYYGNSPKHFTKVFMEIGIVTELSK